MMTIAQTPLDEALAAAGDWAPPRLDYFHRDTRGHDFIFITPRMADIWMRYLNVGNRPPPPFESVQSMANQMASGLFPCNGETIILDWRRYIVSGQLRLESCSLAGSQNPSFLGFETLVAWGMPEES